MCVSQILKRKTYCDVALACLFVVAIPEEGPPLYKRDLAAELRFCVEEIDGLREGCVVCVARVKV